MFDLDRFIADCRTALGERNRQGAIRDIVTKAVSDPSALLATLGEPDCAGVHKLHHSEDLTILNLVWGANMSVMPHDHRMWAVIGVYGGREDNSFWRRIPDDRSRIEPAGAKSLSTGDVTTLGRDIIHSVTNPIPRLTAAIHVYGGDFFAASRSEWDEETLREQPFDVARAMRAFEDARAASVR